MTVTSRQSLLRVARMWHGRVLARQPGLSAWEAVPSGLVTWPNLRGGVPRVTVRVSSSPGLVAR